MVPVEASQLPEFGREFLDADSTFTRIGDGLIGGKAAGLLRAQRDILSRLGEDESSGFDIAVPTLTVIATGVFDSFMERNDLYDIALSDRDDEAIARAFQSTEFPAEFVGDLRSLISDVHRPLAVRSSSLLEDALDHPFAGVYGTKMIPNNQADTDTRFHRFVEAIKFVYASTFFAEPKSYMGTIDRDIREEKMAVIVQEIVGERWNSRFYPAISGVGRSHNFYPTGRSEPSDGVVNLALGLGKEIVDGGITWTYSPAHPKAPPPYAGVGDLMKNTQTGFWAVNMGAAPPHDPIRETEYLVRGTLDDATSDGSLTTLCSTYDPNSERMRPGFRKDGAKVLDFAPILTLDTLPLNTLVRRLIELTREALGGEVEIEFAVALDPLGRKRPRFGFLQARPMMVSLDEVSVTDEDLVNEAALVASRNVLGNGERNDIQDIIYARPDVFEAKHTPRIARDIDEINRALIKDGKRSLLIGFGRWGSSDPWLGIPVDWGQVSSARVIVEATMPGMNPDLSQGSHFFHNLLSFRVLYLSVPRAHAAGIRWDVLDGLPATSETDLVRHVRLEKPLRVRVDGHSGRGVIDHVG
ncbi:MAG: hypothetical protein GF405_01070 [Candidatus Eisenbacteria bacterium]|nr:hypothetical protein [Candidatus Eisenbacteria bacterium]